MEGSCTIYTGDPFWVGIFERKNEKGYSVARYVFGGEPSDHELHMFVMQNFDQLNFSQPIIAFPKKENEIGYKRRQREVIRLVQQDGVCTRAQRAAQAEHERN